MPRTDPQRTLRGRDVQSNGGENGFKRNVGGLTRGVGYPHAPFVPEPGLALDREAATTDPEAEYADLPSTNAGREPLSPHRGADRPPCLEEIRQSAERPLPRTAALCANMNETVISIARERWCSRCCSHVPECRPR